MNEEVEEIRTELKLTIALLTSCFVKSPINKE